jgi:oligopeptide/dipeptide ABC transporter ATP-binding protein
MSEDLIVEVRDLSKTFILNRKYGSATRSLRAVRGVTFELVKGETLGLVGESGSGKSTIGRMLMGLIPPTSGSIRLFGSDVVNARDARETAAVRRRIQFVFQDPQSSLNPRMRIADIVAEPIDIAGGVSFQERSRRIAELLEIVGLPRSCAERYPHEFSGGQRQRIGIARALALRPEFVVCDEPVSALDVSMQAQIVNLLLDLQDQFGLSYLFIAHDLAVVRGISTRVAVMYAGEIVEIAARTALYDSPTHPYTQVLLASVPRPDPLRRAAQSVKGELPSLIHPPSGCIFHTRCPQAFDRCRSESPQMRKIGPGHTAACHLY